MTDIFTKYSELDPALAQRQIEAAHGSPFFDQWALLDSRRSLQEIEAALGMSFDVAAMLDPAAALRQVQAKIDGGGGGGYVAKAVHFSSDTIIGLNTMGLSDTSKITIVYWMRPIDLANAQDMMTIGDTTNLGNPTTLQSGNFWNDVTDCFLDLYPADNSNEFTVVGNAGIFVNGAWTGIFISADTGFVAGNKKGFLYANGIDALLGLQNDTLGAFNIGIHNYNFGLPTPLNGGFRRDVAYEYADMQVWIGEAIDPTGGNISKFVSGGKPVNPSVAASAFGQQTFLFSGDATTFSTNQGSGGVCSLIGTALTNASTSPSD